MHAVLHQLPEFPRVSLLAIAGKPLIVRQLQWLRAIGCERIVVELPPGPLAVAVSEAIRAEPAFPGLTLVPSASPAGDAAADLSSPFLAVPADVIGDGDLISLFIAAKEAGCEAYFSPPLPSLGRHGHASVRLHRAGRGRIRLIQGPGWATRVRSESDALALGLAALEGSLPSGPRTAWPIQIHAAQSEPGVWIARGAFVHPTAVLLPPVLVESDAVIGPGSIVGPSVIVGHNAVVGPGARLTRSSVYAGAMVPDGLHASGVTIRVPLSRPSPSSATTIRRAGAISLLGAAMLLALFHISARPAPSAGRDASSHALSASCARHPERCPPLPGVSP